MVRERYFLVLFIINIEIYNKLEFGYKIEY